MDLSKMIGGTIASAVEERDSLNRTCVTIKLTNGIELRVEDVEGLITLATPYKLIIEEISSVPNPKANRAGVDGLLPFGLLTRLIQPSPTLEEKVEAEAFRIRAKEAAQRVERKRKGRR